MFKEFLEKIKPVAPIFLIYSVVGGRGATVYGLFSICAGIPVFMITSVPLILVACFFFGFFVTAVFVARGFDENDFKDNSRIFKLFGKVLVIGFLFKPALEGMYNELKTLPETRKETKAVTESKEGKDMAKKDEIPSALQSIEKSVNNILSIKNTASKDSKDEVISNSNDALKTVKDKIDKSGASGSDVKNIVSPVKEILVSSTQIGDKKLINSAADTFMSAAKKATDRGEAKSVLDAIRDMIRMSVEGNNPKLAEIAVDRIYGDLKKNKNIDAAARIEFINAVNNDLNAMKIDPANKPLADSIRNKMY